MRDNLIIVRAGDSSLHPTWVRGNRRNFDLFVSYFGAKSRSDDYADHYERKPGLKWPRLAALVKEKQDLFRSYRAIWMPDDDLLVKTETLCRMFDLFHKHDLWLAQPALAPGSHYSHHITRAQAGCILRFTNFVEIMCPIFSQFSLNVLAGTFGKSASGWGLGLLWPYVLNYPRNRIAILDAAHVLHTRPVRGGSFYTVCKKKGVIPRRDLKRICQKHGLRMNFWTYNVIRSD